MQRIINYQALVRPLSRTEISDYESRMRGAKFASTVSLIQIAVIAVFLVPATLAFVGFAIVNWISVTGDIAAGSAVKISDVLFPLVLLAGLVVSVVYIARRVIAHRGRWARWLRLTEFASSNGLSFSTASASPSYPGAIFGLGDARSALDHFRAVGESSLDYGNYRYTTGSGRSRTTHNWGFLALSLERSLPHMVLDSRANNGLFGLTNLPTTFRKEQRLSLEGDFDKYFTLYCPREYERDALYVFTPDLMALLIDTAAPFDVEVVDRWLFVYSKTPFDMAQPAVHQRLLHIVDTVGAKTLSQTDRYLDERIGEFSANMVAPQGQRLSRAFPLGATIVVVALLAFWFAPIVGQYF